MKTPLSVNLADLQRRLWVIVADKDLSARAYSQPHHELNGHVSDGSLIRLANAWPVRMGRQNGAEERSGRAG